MGTFHFRINFHTPDLLGEFEVDGCEGSCPTLLLTRGVTYTLVQDDITNWNHPLDFAYYPDGKHGFNGFEKVPKIEVPLPEACNEPEFMCNPGEGVQQAPLYGIDGVFGTFQDDRGGLQPYEDIFKVPAKAWRKHNYAVRLTIPEDSKSEILFYYCYIHSGMTGMIKVANPLPNSNKLVQNFVPQEYYKEHEEFDAICGTSGVADFHNSKEKYCPSMDFLCETDDNPLFSMCMEAIDCKMNYEMRVEEHKNPLVVFMHQMIPHHENAVNMARIALKHASEAEGWNYGFKRGLHVGGLMRDIINTQNEQIQKMRKWLQKYGQEKPKYCPAPRRQLPFPFFSNPGSSSSVFSSLPTFNLF